MVYQRAWIVGNGGDICGGNVTCPRMTVFYHILDSKNDNECEKLVVVEKLCRLGGGKLQGLIHRILWTNFGKIHFPQACGGIFHSFPRLQGAQKAELESKFEEFWSFSQKLSDKPVQNLFFPHTFPQLVEKSALSPKRGGESVENSRDKSIFSTRENRQLPLTSLTISSISVRKTGFWAMRFSTVSMEEMTVEWSRSMILPILGRDISVI